MAATRGESYAMTWFALATYKTASRADAPGVVVDGKLYEAKQIFAQGLAGVFADWPRAQAAVRQLGDDAVAGNLRPAPERIDAVTAPLRPARIFCAAANYIEHANEMGTVLAAKAQSKPYMFLKLQDTVIGPGDDIIKPPETAKLDWEVARGIFLKHGDRVEATVERIGTLSNRVVDEQR